jgi:hypothetical protein
MVNDKNDIKNWIKLKPPLKTSHDAKIMEIFVTL